MGMTSEIVELLQLFRGRVPDPKTNTWVLDLATDSRKWPKAHALFDRVRVRTLAATNAKDHARECQYCFEEVSLQSLYNETYPQDPFDQDAPYWIPKNAIGLARAIGVPVQEVLAIIAP
jgi:hypothetical protein